MKLKIVVDPTRDEEVIIFTHERTPLVEEMERLILEKPLELLGFDGSESVILEYVKVSRITVESDKTYAYVGTKRYRIKRRLYQIEQQAPDCFVRIHQSCLANLRQIARFEASYSGTLRVVFKNGDVDYVSRRNVRRVKERLGVYSE